MGQNVRIGTVTLQNYEPKICVSLAEQDRDAYLATLKELVEHAKTDPARYKTDLVELRIDGFYRDLGLTGLMSLLQKARQVSEDMPLLATFRSLSQGGKEDITLQEYEQLLVSIAREKIVDAVDVEAFRGGDRIRKKEFVSEIRQYLPVILSDHQMNFTPTQQQLMENLEWMRQLNPDVIKMAVMPQNREDVLQFMMLSEMYAANHDIPLIMISMGELGKISRISGYITGSCITFASYKQSSATGQITLEDMNSFRLF